MKRNEKLIKEFAKKNNLTLKQIAEKCDMSYPTLKKIMDGKLNVYIHYLVNLSILTKIRMDTFLDYHLENIKKDHNL